MKRILSALLAATGVMVLAACAGTQTSGGAYSVKAFKPKNPDSVRVKVSTSTQNIYVMEGDRVLMAVQGCVGTPQTPTPKGNFTINNKIREKRRISQPDAGYPMAYWCEFLPAYGFHEGFVHPRPRTHGCIRLHKEAAARLYALVKIGTPVSIATTQPEDAKFGHFVKPLDQSRDPDPPRSLMLSPSWFRDPPGPLLIEG
ncbi:MAG: L,D-transpeptidase [Chthoniobacteraceae bacterium]